MKRQMIYNDNLCDDLKENLLGKIFIDEGMFKCPKLCQVIGWSKNTEKMNAKLRYVYVKKINTINIPLKKEDINIGGKVKIVNKDIITNVKEPVYKIDQSSKDYFICIFNFGYGDGDDSYKTTISNYDMCTLKTKFKYDKKTLETLCDDATYYPYKGNSNDISDHEFVYYDYDD